MLMIVGTASPSISRGNGVEVMRPKLSLFFIGVQNYGVEMKKVVKILLQE